jgi:S-adenosylmethionine:tRNA ribosyltransferase-isomerase
MYLAEFDFDLPPELIAQYPAESREQSRLMVVNRTTGEIHHTKFFYLPEYLNSSDVLVLNNTKVIPARLKGRKRSTGGKVEVLLLRPLAMETSEIYPWETLIRGNVRIGEVLIFGDDQLTAVVKEKDATGKGVIEFKNPGDFRACLDQLGEVPLPPYIKRPEGISTLDRERYQTVYAKEEGSVAAPTAGLHFSEELLKKLSEKGLEIVMVTLHVGPGTFRPVQNEVIEEHKIDPEWYTLSEEAAHVLTRAQEERRRIIAVGTTTTRLLEYVYGKYGKLVPGSGWADLYIYPGFKFNVIQALITNFHLPRSTLLMLVYAFGGRELMQRAYQEAVRHRYRFYSYGDAMLIV